MFEKWMAKCKVLLRILREVMNYIRSKNRWYDRTKIGLRNIIFKYTDLIQLSYEDVQWQCLITSCGAVTLLSTNTLLKFRVVIYIRKICHWIWLRFAVVLKRKKICLRNRQTYLSFSLLAVTNKPFETVWKQIVNCKW